MQLIMQMTITVPQDQPNLALCADLVHAVDGVCDRYITADKKIEFFDIGIVQEEEEDNEDHV